jgi:hypothetical protein
MKNSMLVALTLAIACGIPGVVIVKQPTAREAVLPTAKAARPLEPVRTLGEVLPSAPPAEAPPAVAEVASPPTLKPSPHAEPPAKPMRADAKPPAAQGSRPAKEPLKDPMARDALALVGLDPAAEEYWYAAINDPDLSAHERQDLIEDLNEEGLSDPKHPGPEDLPVILSRLRIIEVAGPYAMDQVNAEAFQEAYKDLVNLADLALGGGAPVR